MAKENVERVIEYLLSKRDVQRIKSGKPLIINDTSTHTKIIIMGDDI